MILVNLMYLVSGEPMVLLYLMILVNLLVLANLMIPVVLLFLVNLVILLNWAILVNLVIVMHLVILANLVILVRPAQLAGSPHQQIFSKFYPQSAYVVFLRHTQQKCHKSRFLEQNSCI